MGSWGASGRGAMGQPCSEEGGWENLAGDAEASRREWVSG